MIDPAVSGTYQSHNGKMTGWIRHGGEVNGSLCSKGRKMKARQSGMPETGYWESFFNADCVLAKLDADDLDGDVVEFGCGYGTFTEAAARRTKGTVYALDIDPSMIEATRRRVASVRISNVVVKQWDFLAHGCGRPGGSASYVMLFNILHLEEPIALLREAYRALQAGGKLAGIHWNYDPTTPRGPSMDIRPRPEQCRAWAEEAGFQFARYEPLECCPYHYGLLVQRPAPSPQKRQYRR